MKNRDDSYLMGNKFAKKKSDQPKLTKGYKHKTHFEEQYTQPILTTKPKPVGEWTVEWLRQYLSGYSSYDLQLKAITDAHNVALAAERQKVRTLVDALKKLIKLWNASDCNDDPKVIQEAIDEGNSALAKVGQ